jgi:hypothetical protein
MLGRSNLFCQYQFREQVQIVCVALVRLEVIQEYALLLRVRRFSVDFFAQFDQRREHRLR